MPAWEKAIAALRSRLDQRSPTPEANRVEVVQTPRPYLVAAFEGWNDAGEAATSAVSHLIEVTGARPIAEIDAEEFFDFTQVRPTSAITDGARRVVWPATTFYLAEAIGDGRELIIVRGPEPQLRWRTYCEQFVELTKKLRVARVVSYGAYLSEITHSRPVPVAAHSTDEELARRYGSAPSLYEGPTGIVGVLGQAFNEANIPTLSVWASVPCHSLPVSPKAALALLRASGEMIGRSVDLSDLEAQSVEYEQRMDELVEEDEQVAAYVARLEEMEEVASSEISTDSLAEEIERYLRGPRSS
jgi:predicted ATP-grasp superfamily ATP-dependent carboligase